MANWAIFSKSSFSKTPPVGLEGLQIIIAFVFSFRADFIASKSGLQPLSSIKGQKLVYPQQILLVQYWAHKQGLKELLHLLFQLLP